MVPGLWEQGLCLFHCLNIQRQSKGQKSWSKVRHTDVAERHRMFLQPWMCWECPWVISATPAEGCASLSTPNSALPSWSAAHRDLVGTCGHFSGADAALDSPNGLVCCPKVRGGRAEGQLYLEVLLHFSHVLQGADSAGRGLKLVGVKLWQEHGTEPEASALPNPIQGSSPKWDFSAFH